MDKIQIKRKHGQDEFRRVLERRQKKQMTLDQVLVELRDHYRGLDRSANEAFAKTALRMFANYENKWLGQANLLTGQWDEPASSGNDVNLTVPLLTAHVDTAITYYTKVKPRFKIVPMISSDRKRKLAKMAQEISEREYNRMFSYSDFQREAQYLALATVSYRNFSMGYRKDSPIIYREEMGMKEVPAVRLSCPNCGYVEEMAGPGYPDAEELSCPRCLAPGVITEQTVKQVPVRNRRAVRLPRPMVTIPNPISVQPDFNAMSFRESKFVVKRKKIPVKTAEYYYQIDLSGAFNASAPEAEALASRQREPLRNDSQYVSLFDIGEYTQENNQLIEETEMWLDPSEYGLMFVDGALLAEQYPDGLYVLMCGDIPVRYRPANKSLEWVRINAGTRPSSNTGTGLVHLADMNDVINNCLSLEYAVLRTHGFPLRILRGKYLERLPQVLQTIIAERIPDDRPLDDLIHTEPASNTSGLLGVLPKLMEGYMQYVAGDFNPTGGASDLRQLMGTATGAATLQEMMADRQGLMVQMRIEADIDTMFSILYMMQSDERNRELFLEEYDEQTVNAFFETDFRGEFYIEPLKGTDEPQFESVNAFKVQSFAQLTANLTGLRQYDAASFYDIVDAVGETLNIDVTIGAGRKERNLANNKINRIIELYRQTNNPDEFELSAQAQQQDPVSRGMQLFQAVTAKDMIMINALAETQLQTMGPLMNAQQAAFQLQVVTTRIEMELYDWDALKESYSDWLQSDEGQNADIPVQIAVGMLFSYAQQMIDQKKAQQMAEAMAMMPPPEEGEEGDVKSDGSTGPGRPRQVKADGGGEGSGGAD